VCKKDGLSDQGDDAITIDLDPRANIQIDWYSIMVILDGGCPDILPPCRQRISIAYEGILMVWTQDSDSFAGSGYKIVLFLRCHI